MILARRREKEKRRFRLSAILRLVFFFGVRERAVQELMGWGGGVPAVISPAFS